MTDKSFTLDQQAFAKSGREAAGGVELKRRRAIAYAVKQVAAMSGVSVRTLHFYDQTGLLKPAYVGVNGYRFYEEPQLLTLQQILFFRELGFELKQIKQVLGQADFEVAAALASHRKVLQNKLTRTHELIETIDKTIKHLEGTAIMKAEEMFVGFTVSAGDDRFGEHIKLGEGYPVDCKLSAQDTGGTMCIFEFTTGWPRHLNRGQDGWIYVIEGQFDFEVGDQRLRLASGESIFIPRRTAHGFAPVDPKGGKLITVFQPAGTMEEFFHTLGNMKNLPTREDALNNRFDEEVIQALHRLFEAHGMDLLGPRQD